MGSAMAASVVAGIYQDIPAAQKAMGGGFEKEYKPNPAKAKKYNELFEKYKKLGSFIEKELK
jgi:L-ribulokinase